MKDLRLACFSCDVTVPVGAPLLGSASTRAAYISDPLQVHGVVLLGADQPVVIAGVDYTSSGNDSWELWTRELARGAGTTPDRVIFSALHQHTAPLEDHGADEILCAQEQISLPVIDAAFHRHAARRTGEAVAAALAGTQRVTHIGTGEAVVDRIASSRRLFGPDGKVKAMRYSATAGHPELRGEPEGLIDPRLTTISFWNGARALAAIHAYAAHPVSHYGDGEVTYDFVGTARERLRQESAGMHQVYLTGCGGNIAPGKYNDGSAASRNALAERMAAAMREAIRTTTRLPVRQAAFTQTPLPLAPRTDDSHGDARMRSLLADTSAAHYERVRAAFYLAWSHRHARGARLSVPALDFGSAAIALLPGEPFVEFQLAAQKLRPAKLVMTIGYGDYAPVYVCTDAAFHQGGYEPGDWAFVGPGSESVVMDTLARAING